MVPAVLSTRYGIITGMPRGFVTGDAFAIIPALLYLPRARKELYVPVERPKRPGEPWWWRALAWTGRLFLPPPVELRRTWPKTRYFLAAFTAVVAMMFNPNCIITRRRGRLRFPHHVARMAILAFHDPRLGPRVSLQMARRQVL